MHIQPAAPAAAQTLEIDLPAGRHTLAYVLAGLPLVIITATLVTAALNQPPLPLLGLFLAVVASCSALALAAGQTVMGTKLTADRDGLQLKKFLDEQRYNWDQVEDVKVLAATGTFADDPFTEVNERIGIGLFLRGTDRVREHEFDADVILCAGTKEEAATLVKVVEKLQGFQKRLNAPMARPVVKKTRQANQRDQFRAQRSTNDMVAAMRNRAG